MGIQIKELVVGEYRGIKNLTVPDFNHINIFTGGNNAGKTSILEILKNIENPDDFSVFKNMLQGHHRNTMFSDIVGMFPLNSNSIHYSYIDSSDIQHKTAFSKKNLQVQMPEREVLRLQGFIRTGSQKEVNEKTVEVNAVEIEMTCDDKQSVKLVYDFQQRYTSTKEKINFPISFLPSFAHMRKNFDFDALLKDNDLHDELLEILKEFDESIYDILKIEDEYFIRSENYKEAIPLAFYGDGLKKSILILSELLKVGKGILLVDEFETAIHTSAMDNVFSKILKTAIKYDVQLFMTSHSKEAIKKVLLCGEYSDYINHYTLYKVDGENYVRKFSCQQALEMNRQGLELR